MGILDWFGAHGRMQADEAATGAALERIVELANPRLRYARRYRARLLPAVRAAMEYSHELVSLAAPARAATAGAWLSDRCLRAFFATPQELTRAFSRSPEVWTWFEHNPAAEEICAVLSMQLVERQILGIALDGGVLRRDVAQTTVNFHDYRVRICASTEADLRSELECRVLDQLALTAISVASEDEANREALEQERALLRMRFRLLQAQGAGASGLGARAAPAVGEAARIRMSLAINEANLKSLASGPQGLEHQLERLCTVLANPAEHFVVTGRRIRLDNMNIVVAEESDTHGATLHLQIARVPVPGSAPEVRTFVLVTFPRAELLPRAQLLSEAARLLH